MNDRRHPGLVGQRDVETIRDVQGQPLPAAFVGETKHRRSPALNLDRARACRQSPRTLCRPGLRPERAEGRDSRQLTCR